LCFVLWYFIVMGIIFTSINYSYVLYVYNVMLYCINSVFGVVNVVFDVISVIYTLNSVFKCIYSHLWSFIVIFSGLYG